MEKLTRNTVSAYHLSMHMKQWHVFAITAGTAVLAAIVISVGIIRLCFGSDASLPFSPRSLICGNDLNSSRIGFKRLTAQNMSVYSEIMESQKYSIERNNDVTALIDGKKNTL